jgi:carbonic anhydrase
VPDLTHLLEKNRAWAGRALDHNPDFFARLLHQQTPKYLWIGCADSRVPANQIVDLDPGELFVHRNVANVVVHTDLNCLSVIQYAVDVLKVEDIIVCGHYGCGGVEAALRGSRLGLIDNWLWHIRDIYYKHRGEIDALEPAAQVKRLCELNATEQAVNVSKTTVIRNAWERGQKLAIHAWVYSLEDGLIRDLGVGIDNPDEAQRLINP